MKSCRAQQTASRQGSGFVQEYGAHPKLPKQVGKVRRLRKWASMTTPPLPGRYGGDEAQPDDGEPFE